MKKFNSLKDIDTSSDSGKMLLASLSILSGTNFTLENYGAIMNGSEVFDKIVNISNYVYYESTDTEGEIEPNIDSSLDEGKLLITSIHILSSEECKKTKYYGSHCHVESILERILELTLLRERNKKIDLIV